MSRVSGLLAVFVILGSSAAHAQQGDGVFGSASHFTEPTGAAIYRSVCAGCHMADGQGAAGAGTYPALAGNQRLAAIGYPITVVLNGRHGMPGFGRLLSDQQIADVVDYIRRNHRVRRHGQGGALTPERRRQCRIYWIAPDGSARF
jgi:mono/diheme cytochrome c family protein